MNRTEIIADTLHKAGVAGSMQLADLIAEAIGQNENILAIRCMSHRDTPPLNAQESTGAECPICAIEEISRRKFVEGLNEGVRQVRDAAGEAPAQDADVVEEMLKVFYEVPDNRKDPAAIRAMTAALEVSRHGRIMSKSTDTIAQLNKQLEESENGQRRWEQMFYDLFAEKKFHENHCTLIDENIALVKERDSLHVIIEEFWTAQAKDHHACGCNEWPECVHSLNAYELRSRAMNLIAARSLP
jgi:hypothetical protein